MGKALHTGEGLVDNGVFTLWKFTATNYADLLTKVGPVEGDLAFVYNSQGVWLVNRKIKGVYHFQSGVWKYASQELQDQIQGLNLDKILTVGNVSGLNDIAMSDGQVIKAFTGGAFMDFRKAGVTGDIEINNLSVGADESIIEIKKAGVNLFNGNSLFSLTDFGAFQFYFMNTDKTNMLKRSILSGGLGSSFMQQINAAGTLIGGIGIVDNEIGDIVDLSGVDNLGAFIGSKNYTFKSGIFNSVPVGGVGQIIKTKDGAYFNKIFFNAGEAFETQINYVIPTQDNIWTIPNRAIDTFAGLKDILKQKSGKVLQAAFSGIPRKATVTFTTPFADANYSPVIICETVSNSSFSPIVETILSGSFIINMDSVAINNLTAVHWTATKHGEN